MTLDLPPGQRVVLEAYGETPLEAIDQHLRLEAQPVPDPSTLADDDVIVAIRSAAVGWVDLIMASGHYQHLARPPYVPGLEYSGEVVWIGPAVSSLQVGDRVLADGLLTGPRSLGPHQRWGGFASYAVAPARALIPLPADWSFDQGCNLLGNYETAYYCLLTCGQLGPGETVLINGASGSTGLAAVHLAKLVGATVIASGRSTDKLAAVQAQGADHVVVTGDQLDARAFAATLKELTAGRGVDMVYDGVGGPLTEASLRACSFGARYLIVGWAATPFVADAKGKRGAPQVNVIPTNLILMKGLKVLGCPTAIASHRDPEIRPPRLRRILDWVQAGAIHPVVAERYPLSEIATAMRAKWAPKTVGGIVVRPEVVRL